MNVSGQSKRKRKCLKFNEYLVIAKGSHEINKNFPSIEEYDVSPGTALLKYLVGAKNAIENVKKAIKSKNKKNSLQDVNIHHIDEIIVSMLPAIMGHFETYQRHLFAGMFNYSIYLKNFNLRKFLRSFNDFSIDIEKLSAYRGETIPNVGMLLADSIAGWHNPEKVISYFNAFDLKTCIYDGEFKENLEILWQLRHSIVHTGGTLTTTDAQKNNNLSSSYKNGVKQIIFKDQFISEITRRFHPFIKNSTERIGNAFNKNLKDTTPLESKTNIEKFFHVTSKINAWWHD